MSASAATACNAPRSWWRRSSSSRCCSNCCCSCCTLLAVAPDAARSCCSCCCCCCNWLLSSCSCSWAAASSPASALACACTWSRSSCAAGSAPASASAAARRSAASCCAKDATSAFLACSRQGQPASQRKQASGGRHHAYPFVLGHRMPSQRGNAVVGPMHHCVQHDVRCSTHRPAATPRCPSPTCSRAPSCDASTPRASRSAVRSSSCARACDSCCRTATAWARRTSRQAGAHRAKAGEHPANTTHGLTCNARPTRSLLACPLRASRRRRRLAHARCIPNGCMNQGYCIKSYRNFQAHCR